MIIVTGASRGIGKYLLKEFVVRGEEVFGTYLNSLPEDYSEFFVKCDVTDADSVHNFIKSIEPRLSNLVLINCAGISYNSFLHKSHENLWRNVLETNLFGTYNFIRALLPFMRNERFGRIINFSSVVAVKPTPGVSAYSTSKSALWGLSKSVAVENASLNITINNINMGYSELGMINEVPEEYLNSIISQIPAKRLCKPEDIFNTVNYLIQTSYITGSSIDLSGGLV